jgi:hypothetical protein
MATETGPYKTSGKILVSGTCNADDVQQNSTTLRAAAMRLLFAEII